MRKSITAIAALLLLSACSSQPAQSEPVSEPSAASQPAQEPAAEPLPGFDRPAEFGEAVTFPNGLEVTVTSNGSRPVTEEDGVAAEPGDVIAAFTVTVVNDGPARVDGLEPSLSYGGESSTMIANDDLSVFPGETVEGSFERMLPGDAVGDVRVSIADPSFTMPEAIFEGSMK